LNDYNNVEGENVAHKDWEVECQA